MHIGKVKINGRAILAPMAGVADRAFREVCVSFGAAYVVSEMVSSKGIYYSDKKSKDLMRLSDLERPVGIQLFGDDPDIMAFSAKKAMEIKPDIIDINMGCPAPKVTSNGCGSALMRNPKLCGEIVKAVKNCIDVPVTVKIRKGWDENSVNAVEIAKICEDCGADAITIHGRTRKQMYLPYADWEIIKSVKEAVNIPVIGNGDITEASDALKMIEKTGCDLVMIGRGALGNPFIFKQINSLLNNNEILEPAGICEKVEIMLKHVRKICDYKGEKYGMKEARKHVGWYVKGFKGAASLRCEAGKMSTFSDLEILCDRILNSDKNI